MGGAAVVVDVGPVGLVGDGGDIGPQAGENEGGDGGGGPVGAVDHHPHPVEGTTREHRHQVLDVAVGGGGVGRQAPDGMAGGRAGTAAVGGQDPVELGLHRRLGGVGQLEAAGGEEFHPVVGEGIVGGRDHHAGEMAGGTVPGRTGGGQDAEVDDVGALTGQAGRQGGLEEGSGLAGVAGHQKGPGREGPGCGPTESQDQLGPEFGVGHTADTVGAEPDTHGRLPLRVLGGLAGLLEAVLLAFLLRASHG